ncbi:MAG: OmpH family outer membrane protein [Phenylobacterium sp.]
MTFKPFIVAACAAAVTLSAGSAAFAQQAAAPPAVTHGAPVPGVCIISVEAAIGGSTVGKYVNTRMQQIVGQVNAELNGEKTALENEDRALAAQRATLDQNSLEQRGAALQVRGNALQRKAQQREREVSATEQKAVSRIGQEMEPLIRQAYQAKGCSLLLQRNALVIANPAMDITPAVVTALNAKITQFAFDRERLDQAATSAPPAIVQTPTAPKK